MYAVFAPFELLLNFPKLSVNLNLHTAGLPTPALYQLESYSIKHAHKITIDCVTKDNNAVGVPWIMTAFYSLEFA